MIKAPVSAMAVASQPPAPPPAILRTGGLAAAVPESSKDPLNRIVGRQRIGIGGSYTFFSAAAVAVQSRLHPRRRAVASPKLEVR